MSVRYIQLYCLSGQRQKWKAVTSTTIRLWENIMVCSLVPAYHNKELLFRKWVKSFFALPLLPNHKIEEGFGLLKSSRPQIHHDGVPLNTQVISFVVYYERFWMGEMRDKMCVWGSAHCTNNRDQLSHSG
ncbi:uncharacterized protein LOC123514586 [Portunus trituberculatus]|uniref:uncharacterized protein LOC123514586 n=1 Tax=Portunus trituberculatus TaxID=210409 RepID=UPI001E1D02B6|nr:uncharacterized protein LOC123514586 [Portunus trituberculatus]